MKENNPDSTDIFEENLIDTFYPQRPDDLEDVCLYNFVPEYTKSGVDKDGNRVYRKLNKHDLSNHKVSIRTKKMSAILSSALCPLP